MCGICGVYALDGLLNPEVGASIGAMTDSLAHRGPDGRGEFADLRAALGHRRLAIIDREGGAQPMTDEARLCGSCSTARSTTIAGCGRIWPRADTCSGRPRTPRSSCMRTPSTASQCVERLTGMFAFAIYDSVKRELFLARDRLGKKPLFYTVLDGALHFASEMKAFQHSPAWDATIDTSTLEGYLSLGYILAPRTIYKHVRKLEPGTLAVRRPRAHPDPLLLGHRAV